MLVDVVLVVDGQYWRARRQWSVLPRVGATVQVLGGLSATVAGSTDVESGLESSVAAAAVLLRVPAAGRGGLQGELQRAGWHRLL